MTTKPGASADAVTPRLELRLVLPFDWRNIERLRRALKHLVIVAYASEDLADAFAMAACELTENALRYGDSLAVVRVEVTQELRHLVVSVTNGVPTGSTDLARLREQIATLEGFDDPADGFRELLAERSRRDGGRSGLGLARVLYEGSCRLEYETAGDREVTIRALCPLAEFALPTGS